MCGCQGNPAGGSLTSNAAVMTPEELVAAAQARADERREALRAQAEQSAAAALANAAS